MISLGSSCSGGTCAARPWVGPGEACGQAAVCRYKSVCLGGICVETGLIGEACSDAKPCAAGFCDASTHVCTAKLLEGAICADPDQCLSDTCDIQCAPRQTFCLEP